VTELPVAKVLPPGCSRKVVALTTLAGRQSAQAEGEMAYAAEVFRWFRTSGLSPTPIRDSAPTGIRAMASGELLGVDDLGVFVLFVRGNLLVAVLGVEGAGFGEVEAGVEDDARGAERALRRRRLRAMPDHRRFRGTPGGRTPC
jgi:hypothetical protein